MVNQHLEKIIDASLRLARKHGNQFVSLEHLLLVLISDYADVRHTLQQCGTDVEGLYKEILNTLHSPLFEHTIYANAHTLVNTFGKTKISSELKRVLQRTFLRIQTETLHDNKNPNILLLISLVAETNSKASQLLKHFYVTEDKLLAFIQHSNIGQPTHADETHEEGAVQTHNAAQSTNDKTTKNNTERNKKNKFLDVYTINLNEKARRSEIDPIVGRGDIVQRVQQVLLRRKKNNALLIGEAGVGKTAIFEALALAVVNKTASHHLQNVIFHALDITALLAGAKYRGDFEQRLKGLLEEIAQVENAILCIDEAHTLVGAGSSSEDSMDAANLLKPVLAAGDLRCIGATTQQEYRRFFSDDKALMRRFQTIQVPEPTEAQTYSILKAIMPYYESFHDVLYTNTAIKEAIALSSKYIHERCNPDKSIDLLDEAGAWQKLLGQKTTIGKREIACAVSRITGIPSAQLTTDHKKRLLSLADNLQKDVFGQTDAVMQISNSIKGTHLALRSEHKPLGCFLFVGPTGVGKTALCQSLATHLHMKLLRFDMSEYNEAHSTARLVGAPPGYIGFDQAGALTEAVWNNPYSIILLDEIEKAHPNVYNLLLQVMDYGCLTDNHDRTVSFRHTIVIMTSNVGMSYAMRNQLGFQTQDNQSDVMIEVCRLFTPEFRNRLDSIILFRSISPEIAAQIVDAQLLLLRTNLFKKGLTLHITDAARKRLLDIGFDAAMGARPLQRAIETHIQQPLAHLLLSTNAPHGCQVLITVNRKQKTTPFSVRLQPPASRNKKNKRMRTGKIPALAQQ